MPDQHRTVEAECPGSSKFWDALATHHASLENNYLDAPAIRRMMGRLGAPVLVVGGGQGLLVAEIRKNGIPCEGVDFSGEMVRQARLRRGITLIQADARAMPIPDRTYGAVVFATGVIDFTEDEAVIKEMLREGGRVAQESGRVFVAFYKLSEGLESFMSRVGLLKNNFVPVRESFELYQLKPRQMILWVAKKAGLSPVRAAMLLFGMSLRTTIREKKTTFRMQRLFRKVGDPAALINAAPERQPYRNEGEIRKLFERLVLPIRGFETYAACFVVETQVGGAELKIP